MGNGIVQLLHKLSIRGVQGSEKLLRVIKVDLVIEHRDPITVTNDLPGDSVTDETSGRIPSRTISRPTPSSSVSPLPIRLFIPADSSQHSPPTPRPSDYPTSSLVYPRHTPSQYLWAQWHAGKLWFLLIFCCAGCTVGQGRLS